MMNINLNDRRLTASLAASSLILFLNYGLVRAEQANDILPGLWEITLNTKVAVSQNWAPPPVQLSRCLTESDAINPERLFADAGMMGVMGCSFDNRQLRAGHVSFDVACEGKLGITGHGDMDFTAKSIDGSLDVRFGEAERTAMQNKLHAIYKGECEEGQNEGFSIPEPENN